MVVMRLNNAALPHSLSPPSAHRTIVASFGFLEPDTLLHQRCLSGGRGGGGGTGRSEGKVGEGGGSGGSGRSEGKVGGGWGRLNGEGGGGSKGRRGGGVVGKRQV